MDGLDNFLERGDGISGGNPMGGMSSTTLRLIAVVLIIIVIVVAFYMTRTEAMENSRWDTYKQYLNTEKIRAALNARVNKTFA
jgi:carbon starvation protein CstA